MPLTPLQAELAKLLAGQRSEDSHLAGGAALHLPPEGVRYSNDLDYFHDSVERVATASQADRSLLSSQGYDVRDELAQVGFVRAVVARGDQATKIEWAHDSSWRFMPVQQHPDCGTLLHPIDLAVNKLLALVGRDEPRDYVDVQHIHRHILPLGALCWAASGKDPGFTPRSLLELLRRRGKVRPEELQRLQWLKPLGPQALKERWLVMLEEAEAFMHSRPAAELGCLYYHHQLRHFVQPSTADDAATLVLHQGRPGGSLPALES